MSEPNAPPRATRQLKKLHSWSPGTVHEENWARRCRRERRRCSCSLSVTDDDVDELRACFDLGFAFDSPEPDQRLARAFPALEMYHAVKKPLGRSLSTSSSEVGSGDGGFGKVLDLGGDPKEVKARLKQWAQVVACVMQQQTANSQVKIFPCGK